MRAWLAGPMLLGVFAFTNTGCTVLAGLDDLGLKVEASDAADDGGPATTPSSSGSSPSGSAGAGGASSPVPGGGGVPEGAGGGITSNMGGDIPSCASSGNDFLDVSSVAIAGDAGFSTPAIVAVGDRFGIVYEVAGTNEIAFELIERDGTQVVRHTLAADDPAEHEPSIALSASQIVVPAPVGSSLAFYRFGVEGDVLPTATLPTAWTPPQSHVTGSQAGVLATFADANAGAQLRAVFLHDDGGLTEAETLPGNGAHYCCSSRRWATGRFPGTDLFGAMWRKSSNALGNEFTTLTSASSGSQTHVTMDGIATRTFPIEGELAFAACGEIVTVSSAGVKVADSKFSSATACDIGSTGKDIRLLEASDDSLTWSAVNRHDGSKDLLLSLGGASTWSPAIAYDGVGFGMVWTDSGSLHYAHVNSCE